MWYSLSVPVLAFLLPGSWSLPCSDAKLLCVLFWLWLLALGALPVDFCSPGEDSLLFSAIC